jgi:hypothetical protein
MNYKEVITLAVDAFAADGNAFVTEYAGASDVVSSSACSTPPGTKAFSQLDPVAVVDTLAQQGLISCFCEDVESVCQYNHPLLQGILLKHLPPPTASRPTSSTAASACYADQIDLMAWDGAGFAADFEQRLIDPGQHAVEPPQPNDYLTRMYTTISPDEMMEDPIFRPNRELPEVPNMLQANRLLRCDGHADLDPPRRPRGVRPQQRPLARLRERAPLRGGGPDHQHQGRPDDPRQQHRAINKALEAWNNKMDPSRASSRPAPTSPRRRRR